MGETVPAVPIGRLVNGVVGDGGSLEDEETPVASHQAVTVDPEARVVAKLDFRITTSWSRLFPREDARSDVNATIRSNERRLDRAPNR